MRAASATLLLLLGLAQMAGDLANWPTVKGIAAATGASPAPKVFSAAKGLETYSSRFFIDWNDEAGKKRSSEITPQAYARLKGPYNRRNVYGAVLAYGPVLSTDERGRAMYEAVAHYALCGNAPLLRELGLPISSIAGSVKIRLIPRPGSNANSLPLILEPPCR